MICLTTGIHRIFTRDETRFTAVEKGVYQIHMDHRWHFMSDLLKRVKTNALLSAALYALLGAITLILGGILVYGPFEAFTTVVRFIGVFLVYAGLSDLWISVQVGKDVRQAEKDASAMRNAIDIKYRDIKDE